MLDHMTPRDILVLNEEGFPVDQAKAWIIPMTQEGPTVYKDHFTSDLVEKTDKAGAFAFQWRLTDTLPSSSVNAISDPSGKLTLKAEDQSTYIVVASHGGYEDFVSVVNGDHIPGMITLKKMSPGKGPCVETLFSVYDESGEQALGGAAIRFQGPCKDELPELLSDGKGTAKACLPSNCAIKAEIEKAEYATHAFTFTPMEAGEHWKIYLKRSNALTSPPSPIATGTVIVLDNIYYDFNKSVIRKGDAGELIALADIMKKYPDLTIELTSHTDTRGSAEYNMELSARRSESSKAYLVLLGIDADRIVTKAAGESSPRNKCVDGVPCSEQEHQYNRRTEVRIINPAQGMQIRYKEQ
jgi:outer membrane protein OmpA-like peptidoglycan-associated protein